MKYLVKDAIQGTLLRIEDTMEDAILEKDKWHAISSKHKAVIEMVEEEEEEQTMNENTVFSELWWTVRDYYAPYMTAPEAARKAVKAMADNGHEAVDMGKRFLMVDDELFEIKKHRNWSHFELIQHGCRPY